VAAVSHTFTFDSPERALLFVRQVFANCQDVATFRDGVTVRVIDGHHPPQTEKLTRLARTLGSSSIPPPLPGGRVSKLPTLSEAEEIDVDED
jgi:hypothetical protein